ncbi:MAG: T9SS type A sorting domain-containing protein [Bacteroidota bacterium]
MKRKIAYLSCCYCLALSSIFGQPCPPGTWSPSSQEEIDNFATLYPGCTELQGGLTFNNNEILNLEGLSQITRINGSLRISQMDSLKSLHGLHNVTYIDRLVYYLSTGLDDLSGLESLDTIAGDINIDIGTLGQISGLDNLKYIGNNVDVIFSTIGPWSGMNNLNYLGGKVDISTSTIGPISGMNGLKTINGRLRFDSNKELGNISGWQNLETVKGDLWLDLEIMSSSTSFAQVTGFGQLQTVEQNMVVESAPGIVDFSNFSNLSDIGGYFYVYDCENLRDFSGLENLDSIGGNLELEGLVGLESLDGLNGLTSIGENFIIFDCESLASIHGLENLRSIGGSLGFAYNFTLPSLAGLENLETINGQLSIFNFDELVNLLALEKLNPNDLTEVILSSNDKLSVCESISICNFAGSNPGEVNLSGNAPGCNELEELLNACSDNFSKVNYLNFYDLNQNQIFDPEEPIYVDAAIEVDPLDFTHYSDDPDGGTLFLEEGNYNLSVITGPKWDLTTSPSEVSIDITESNTCDTVIFGLFPNQEESLLLTFIQSPPTRCNEFVTFEVSTKNVATTTESGTLWLEADPDVLAIEFVETPDTIAGPFSFGWHFDNLFPSQTFSRAIRFQIPGPPDFPLGEPLNFFSYIEFEEQVWVQEATGFRYQPEVRCSYDPNDKLVHPNREGNYTLFEEFLVYTVRFQNTGNDYARDVVIRDTLDANLNASTFQILGTSHPNQLSTRLLEDQYLTFDFSNIFLPDSTADFEGSQGYVSYIIEGKEGLAENTAIENTASIYFDFNPPIVTNTTQNIMVSELPTTSTSVLEPIQFSVFPNPTRDLVQVTSEEGTGPTQLRLYDHLGQLLDQREWSGSIILELNQYPAGLYWIELSAEKAKVVQKIVRL